jgi:exodeoxyribonuclease VII large subunit
MRQYNLSELCAEIQETLECKQLEHYWVRAEIASISVRGHCYMELIEKSDTGILAAKLRATCWSNVYNILSPYFLQSTGHHLSVGMQVLLEVSIEFHAVYGLSLNIWNIDPNYTLGDLARQRQETINQLIKDGVLELQKQLTLPTLIRRIAVISSVDAAGYGDFCHQIQTNRHHFVFQTQLYAATMQGDSAAHSIIQALNAIAKQENEWDLVVIIRGGGATTDLSCFDDYNLACHCAQFPLPIITGIGHTRDISVVDMVAHTSVKTPTAAAEWVIQHVTLQFEHLEQLNARLQRTVQLATNKEHNRLSLYKQRIKSSFLQIVSRERGKLELWDKTIALHSPKRIFQMGYSLTYINGQVLRDCQQVKQGDIIQTHLANGSIQSKIQ